MSQSNQDLLENEAADTSGEEDLEIVSVEHSHQYNVSSTPDRSYEGVHDLKELKIVLNPIDNMPDSEEDNSHWSGLPSLAVENIYSFLNRGDQSRMAQVCKRWSEDYSSPSLWKTVKFYLPENDFHSEICPEVRCAQKYGKMFRNVEVISKRVREHLISVIKTQLRLFLQALATESDLRSIKFINMKWFFRVLDDTDYTDVFEDIVNFLRSQKHLVTVEFLSSSFSREEGAHILSVLSENSGDTLRFLFLKRFIHFTEGPPSPVTSTMLSRVSLKSLHTVEIEYSRLFETLMSRYQEVPEHSSHANDSFCNLKLVCGVTINSDCRGIAATSWKNVNKCCPNLKIDLDVTLTNQARRGIDLFIVKFMRVKTLELKLDEPSATHRTDISYLFNHLVTCKCNDHLEVLNVLWKPPITDLAAALVPFLQACPMLQTVQINARYCSRGVENILKSILENRPKSLKALTLWFSDVVNPDDEEYLASVSEEYYPLLQVVGIGVFLLVDPGRRLRRRNVE